MGMFVFSRCWSWNVDMKARLNEALVFSEQTELELCNVPFQNKFESLKHVKVFGSIIPRLLKCQTGIVISNVQGLH